MIKPVYEVSEAGKGFWSKFLLILVIGLLYLGGLVFISGGIFLFTIKDMMVYVFSICFAIIPGIAIICYMFYSTMTMFAVYRFEKEGLYVKYPFRKEKCISWDAFQQICIVYNLRTGSHRPLPYSSICFVRKGEKKNFLNRWKTGNPFKYDKVIAIPYTEEIYEGIKERCPYEIVDLRDTPGYESWK